MSTTTVQASALASEDWQIAEEDTKNPISLVIQQRRRAHIFPWFRFVYAEGDNKEVKIAFATHMVTVNGHGLAALLAAISTQRVFRLIQPTEKEAKFGVRGDDQDRCSDRCITSITVKEYGKQKDE